MACLARVFQTYNINEANIIAHITPVKGKADLCAMLMPSRGMAYGDERWYVTKNRGEASKIVYFGSQGQASLKVHFVKSLGDAGWQTQHRLKGML